MPATVGRVLCTALFVLLLDACHREPSASGEIHRPDEQAATATAYAQAQAAVDTVRQDHVGRDAHAKAHGCARVLFSINADVPPPLRYGLFAEPGASYRGWLRFSNGSHDYRRPDTAADSRGMAIKLMGVPGERLLVDGVDNSLDLLLIDSPAFLARDGAAYLQARGSASLSEYFFNHSANPLQWRWRELNLMRQGFRPPPASPLFIDYFGVLAYQLGPQVMKFSARACDSRPQRAVPSGASADFLGTVLAEQLARQEACFEFRVQLQNVAAGQHVEDATEVWREQDSPWFSVARLTLPVQQLVPGRDAYCENLAFNPWRTLPAQRPLGELNRMRKSLYEDISAYRQQQNQAQQAAPQPW